MSLTTWPLSSPMTAHEMALGLTTFPWPAVTLTTDEHYSVSPGLKKKADLVHSVVPQPSKLFTVIKTCNLIWQDGNVLLTLTCAAGSYLHMAVPDHFLTWLAYLHCAESPNKIFTSLQISFDEPGRDLQMFVTLVFFSFF